MKEERETKLRVRGREEEGWTERRNRGRTGEVRKKKKIPNA